MSTDLKRTTGTLVFLNWSGRGDVSARKLAWYHATRRWDAVRLGSQFAWVVPASVSWKSIRETLEATLVRSDKVELIRFRGHPRTNRIGLR